MLAVETVKLFAKDYRYTNKMLKVKDDQLKLWLKLFANGDLPVLLLAKSNELLKC